MLKGGYSYRVKAKRSGCTESSACACLFTLWVTTLTSKILVAWRWQDYWITAFHLIAQYFYLTGYIPLFIQRRSLKFYRDVLWSPFWMGSEFWAALLQPDEKMLMETFQSPAALWDCTAECCGHTLMAGESSNSEKGKWQSAIGHRVFYSHTRGVEVQRCHHLLIRIVLCFSVPQKVVISDQF